MSKQQEGGALPSSQGGLTMYTDANVGIEFDPRTIVAFSIGVGIATIVLSSPRVIGLFL